MANCDQLSIGPGYLEIGIDLQTMALFIVYPFFPGASSIVNSVEEQNNFRSFDCPVIPSLPGMETIFLHLNGLFAQIYTTGRAYRHIVPFP
jgi:hypothetical protein